MSPAIGRSGESRSSMRSAALLVVVACCHVGSVAALNQIVGSDGKSALEAGRSAAHVTDVTRSNRGLLRVEPSSSRASVSPKRFAEKVGSGGEQAAALAQGAVAGAKRVAKSVRKGSKVKKPASGTAADADEAASMRVPSDTGVFLHTEEEGGLCDGCKDVYYEMSSEGAWALVLKLSQNQFCFNSSKWLKGHGFNHHMMLNKKFPDVKEYDAKSPAYHNLKHVRKLKFESSFGETVTVNFADEGTPMELLSSNTVPFAEYPDWYAWKRTFAPHSNYSKAAVFMRAGQAILDPMPPCRSGNYDIQGCGSPCTFCFYVSKGEGCPASGGSDDITVGLGHNLNSCDSDLTSCSTSTPYDTMKVAGSEMTNRLLVWALVDSDSLAGYTSEDAPEDKSTDSESSGPADAAGEDDD